MVTVAATCIVAWFAWGIAARIREHFDRPWTHADFLAFERKALEKCERWAREAPPESAEYWRKAIAGHRAEIARLERP